MNNVYDPRLGTIKINGKTYKIDLRLYDEVMKLPNGIGLGRLLTEALIAFKEGEIDLQASYDKLIEYVVAYTLYQKKVETIRETRGRNYKASLQLEGFPE
jgi:hypothetical protein